MQTAKITCKVICNGDSVSVRSPSTSSISRQLCHDGSGFLELKTQSCIYTNINACFESNQVVLPLNLIFSVVDGALVKSAFKATKLFSHKYTVWSDEEFTGRKHCVLWLLKNPVFSGATVSISSQWILSNEIIIHVFLFSILHIPTAELYISAAVVMSVCRPHDRTGFKVWIKANGHCSLLPNNKTHHSNRLVWTDHIGLYMNNCT